MVQKEVSGRGMRDPRVCAAMQEVPRHLFVPPDQRKYAYLDGALPIGNGQTITSPYVVAFMTEKLEPQTSDKVLEIGTGSGYQAVGAQPHRRGSVHDRNRGAAGASGDAHDPAARLRQRPRQDWRRLSGLAGARPLRQDHCHVLSGKRAPALVDQLKEGGRLVVPLGERFQQTLYLFRKTAGQLQREKLESTFFVPMTGDGRGAARGEERLGNPAAGQRQL